MHLGDLEIFVVRLPFPGLFAGDKTKHAVPVVPSRNYGISGEEYNRLAWILIKG